MLYWALVILGTHYSIVLRGHATLAEQDPQSTSDSPALQMLAKLKTETAQNGLANSSTHKEFMLDASVNSDVRATPPLHGFDCSYTTFTSTPFSQ